MSDLVAFLKARLDEDEAVARTAAAVAGPDWAWKTDVTLGDETTDYITSADGTVLMDTMGGIESDAPHVARHDPARVLREVEAKRAILDEHGRGYPVTYPEPSGQPTCYVCHAGGWDWEPENWPCATVRALAAVYSDHPDYDPKWATS